MHSKIIYLHAKLFFNLASTFFINYSTMSIHATSKWGIVGSISQGHNSLSLINFRNFNLNFLSPSEHHHTSAGWIDPRIQLVQLPSAAIHQSHSQYTIINVTKGEQYQEIDCLLRNTQRFDSVFASLGMESLDVLSGGQSPCVAWVDHGVSS